MSTNAYNPRVTNYDCIWNSFNLFLVNKVKPKMKLKRKPIKRGTTGDVVLGEYAVATEGEVSVMVPDISPATIIALCPWMTASSNQVLSPDTPNQNLYSYAALLTLHPHDLASGTVTQDLNFPMAVPTSMFDMERDGEDEKSAWEVIFTIYPDFTKLTASTPKLVYGYLGAVPS